jgi:sugar/nucleoside kinase (ribokinase family)
VVGVATVQQVIAAVGDLIEDVVVRLGGSLQTDADTPAEVVRRRGGSAANVAVAVARAGYAARFIGRVGDDAIGGALVDALRAEGVDVIVQRGGRTGTIVVMVDGAGERSFLTDRGAAIALDDPQPGWLEGAGTLHVPVYSLVGEPLGATTRRLVSWAHGRGLTVSVDASSASVIDDFGADALVQELRELAPHVLFCNQLEAQALGTVHPIVLGAEVVVVKRGREPATVLRRGAEPVDVPVPPLEGVRDTTGAGDAFAAGYLVAAAGGADPVECTRSGHAAAAAAITAAST